jgi:acetyltransferase-like isoleucine patch superfamily enzyme
MGDVIGWVWQRLQRAGAVKPGSHQASRFASFGRKSMIAFPPAVLHGVDRIVIGAETTVGAYVSLSTGMLVRLDEGTDPLLTIGDRCVIGKGSSIVAHAGIEVGDDVMTGPHVYITDQNHGYEDLDIPIGRQMWRNAPVRIGAGSWIGTGAVVLPGTTIGRNVVVAAGSVVRGEIPDYCVVAGVPGRVVKRYVEGQGWVAPDAAADQSSQE